MFEGALPDAGRARRASPREVAAARHLPGAVRDALPAIAAAGGRAARRAAHGAVAARQRPRAARRCTTSTPPRSDARTRWGSPPRSPDDPGRPAPARPGLSSRSSRATTSVTPRPTCAMLTGEEPSPQHARAVEQYLMLDRRPRLQRLDLHRPGDRLHRRRRRRLPGRRHRRAVRAAARRRAEPGPGHPGRDRHPGPDRPLDPASGCWPATGSWASATPSTAPRTRARGCCAGSPSRSRPRTPGPSGWSTLAEQVERRVVEILAELKPGPRAAHQRRVLRRGGDGAVRAAARDVHPDVRRRPGGRLVAPTCSSRPATARSSARPPGTSARRRPSPCRPAEDVAVRTPQPVRRTAGSFVGEEAWAEVAAHAGGG